MKMTQCKISNCGSQPIQAGTEWIQCTFQNTPIYIDTPNPKIVGCSFIDCDIHIPSNATASERAAIVRLLTPMLSGTSKIV